jgi:hypothetical protein
MQNAGNRCRDPAILLAGEEPFEVTVPEIVPPDKSELAVVRFNDLVE